MEAEVREHLRDSSLGAIFTVDVRAAIVALLFSSSFSI